jgi:hypothetical protein
MRARGIIVGTLMAVAISATAYYLVTAPQRRAEAGLQSAIATVRADSLPANAADFRQMLGKPQGKNAFDVLQRLEKVRLERYRAKKPSVSEVMSADFSDPAIQSEFSQYLSIFDEAATCETYVAARRWEDGLAVLFPEYTSIKKAAQLAEGRGCIKLNKGDVSGALADAEKIASIARFLRSERHVMAVLMSQSLDMYVERLVFQASPQFEHGDWLRARGLIETILQPLEPTEWLVGDMVMFNETVRAVCEGSPEARDLMEAAASAEGVSNLKRLSNVASAGIQADSLLAWKNLFDSAKSVVDYDAGDAAYDELLARTVTWTLVHGFPPEVAKTIEQLGPTTVFRGAYLRAVRGDMVRSVFRIAWQKESLPHDAQVESTAELRAKYTFSLTPVGFSLTYNDGGRPIEVFYPKKP